MTVDMDEIRTRYEALSIPTFPGEREWPDRLRSWSDFLRFGEKVAEELLDLRDAERAGDPWAFEGEFERRRAMAPELFELLMDTFVDPVFLQDDDQPSRPRRG